VIVIGVGNDLRGDDAAGLEVARRCRALLADVPDIRVQEFEGEAIGLLDVWDGADAVVLIDAVRSSGAPAGTVHRFDVARDPVPALFARSSSHAIGIGEVIELARRLGRLPSSVILIGIEGARFAAGRGMGESVAGALDVLAGRAVSEARALLAPPPT
jgi:hydrogenase maturation protease